MVETFKVALASAIIIILVTVVGPSVVGLYVYQARMCWLKATVAMLNTLEEANKNGKESKD